MLGINSNINSLVAQQNLSTSGSALSQAITRLSSGKRINSAADDAAGLAISNIMQTQVNGLNQGVSNANDGVSMVQTASSGLSSLTSSLQTIRQLAVEASDGSMTDTDRAALQKEVSQQVSEINRIASQTTFNGMNVLDGSMGTVSFQVGANVGQSISLNLSQDMSAAQLGAKSFAQAGNTLGSYTNLSLKADGSYSGTQAVAPTVGTTALTKATVAITGGKVSYTDQDNNTIAASTTVSSLNGKLGAIDATTLSPAAADKGATGAAVDADSLAFTIGSDGTVSWSDTNGAITDAGTIADLNSQLASAANDSNSNAGLDVAGLYEDTPATAAIPSGTAAITTINVLADGKGNFTLTDQNNQALSSDALNALQAASNGALSVDATTGVVSLSQTAPAGATLGSALSTAVESLDNDTVKSGAITTTVNATNVAADAAIGSQLDGLNAPTTVAGIDISTQQGASNAMEAIDNALNTVDNLQATLGAAQNRFTSIATTQQAQSTDLSQAQSSIQDADFAQETANLSKAQVLQQAGISVLAQANSQPQQILKLLQ